jgi:hypothetical protein
VCIVVTSDSVPEGEPSLSRRSATLSGTSNATVGSGPLETAMLPGVARNASPVGWRPLSGFKFAAATLTVPVATAMMETVGALTMLVEKELASEVLTTASTVAKYFISYRLRV